MNAAPQPTPSQGCRLVVRLFGGFHVEVNGHALPPLSLRKAELLFAWLILKRGERQEYAHITRVFWPSSIGRDTVVSDSVRKNISEMKKWLGECSDILRKPTRSSIYLDLSNAWVDVFEFEKLVKKGDHASLAAARELYRGPLLEGYEEEWIQKPRAQYARSFTGIESRTSLSEIAEPARPDHFSPSTEPAGKPSAEARPRQLKVKLAAALTAAAISLVGLFWLNGRSSVFQPTGGGRLLVHRGLALPGLRQPALDTGLVRKDFPSDSFDRLVRRPFWMLADAEQWPEPILRTLPPAPERARLLLRLDRKQEGKAVLLDLLKSPFGLEQAEAALILVGMDENYRELAVAALNAAMQKHDTSGGQALAEVGRALTILDPSSRRRVAARMRTVIAANPNNFARIPAARTLAFASPPDRPAVTSLLNNLLIHDPNNEIRALAMYVLYELEPRFKDEALKEMPPLLADPNGYVRGAAWKTLKRVGRDDVEAVIRALSREDVLRVSDRFVSRAGWEASNRALLARSPDAFRTAMREFSDYLLDERNDVEVVTSFIATKMARFALAESAGVGRGAVNWLIREMEHEVANQWAVYRHGCAQAVHLVVPRSESQSVIRLVERIRRGCRKTHMRIALAVVLEWLTGAVPAAPAAPTASLATRWPVAGE